MKFYQLNLRPQGNSEWNFTLRGMTDRQLLAAADWARRNQVFDRAVNTADRTRSEHDFAVRFLAPFYDTMESQAKAVGLHLDWVYGLIRQESRFILGARSSAGASGLMQLMPGTARYVAKKIGLANYRPDQVTDMDTNLLLGTNYLRLVLDQLQNTELLATAAYNAGPGRPRAWRALQAKPLEGAIFAETIPLSETRDYVKKVMSNAVYYGLLFDPAKPQSLKGRIGVIEPSQDVTASDVP
jgi:soluble lytic murein transglycosylase